MQYYRQCQLKNENTITVAWIEERGAKLGYRVTLEDYDGWWTVQSVGDHRMEEKQVKKHERDYLRQRAASDI